MKKLLKIVMTLMYLIVFFKLDNLELKETIFLRMFYLAGGSCILINFTKNKFLEILYFLLNGIITIYI